MLAVYLVFKGTEDTANRPIISCLLVSPPVLFFARDSFQQNRSGLVVGVLGDEFAAEGFGEDGLRELVNVRFRRPVTRFERVCGFLRVLRRGGRFLAVRRAEAEQSRLS